MDVHCTPPHPPGREVEWDTPMIKVYSDGSVERVLWVE